MTAIQTPVDTASAMEDIHGVDVSWLHHSTRDHHHRQQAPSSPGLTRDAPPKTSSHGGIPARPRHDEQQIPEPTPATARPASPPRPPPAAASSATPPQKIPPKRPALLSRGSADKNASGTTPPDSKNNSRRNSWMNSISSKFSSQNSPAQTTHTQAQGSPAAANSATHASPSANGALNGIQAASGGSNGAPEPYIPQQPKSSFVGNVLRRLSSGTQVGTAGKVYPNGGMCPRKVMNVDPNRERCLVPELDQNKLRKVAFCVDVEIAGGPKYKDDVETDDKKVKRKDKKLKERGEGEALRNPDAVAEEKDKDGVVAIAQEVVGNDSEPNPEGTVLDEDKQEPSRKKEKKKRSEAERKERKEKKRKKAEENGTIPMELTRDDDSASAEGIPAASGAPTPRAQDRPTIDPLRIYRRCCQLRESPILKRISDQLAAPRACSVVQPGVVTCLDLTGSRLQLADVLTLSDWLAIVPVKKLFLEDADLNDEKIRVILAGLLAAKVPEPPKRRDPSNDDTQDGLCQQGSCAVKKLVLKNNPKITAEGWKHIALFLYMCKSIMAIDVSMIPFPRSRPQVASPPTNSTQAPSPTKDSRSGDVAEIFSKAISERLGGSELQELAMAECNLTSSSIRKIIDGCVISGIQRLSLATNDIDAEGLEHVLHYLRSGVCQGIDLGGNDLRSLMDKICDSIKHCQNSPLWALCLQDTGLTPEALKTLIPTLISLPSFRFLDLSHNRGLFLGQTSLCLLRKYMPQFKELKRIHLVNVDMKPEDAIAIAEILPDCPHIAHINILENPEITRVATSTDEETQEEAAALYASLTLAAKLSKSLICIDVDIPAPEQGEVIKALAKQVVAYCLRNIESINEVPELRAAPKEVEVPDILMRLVGPEDSDYKETDNASDTADNDYIVGGTGIAKALSYCLSHKETDLRRVSVPVSGTSTPRSRSRVPVLEEPSKARAMSKDLLETARNTRNRIQPALIREAKGGNDLSYRRLLFLDQTLQGMIQRFEDEYPETRLQPSDAASTTSSKLSSSPPTSVVPTLENSVSTDFTAAESDEDEPSTLRSRHNSDVSLASRHMSLEEGRLHRFGHRVRTGNWANASVKDENKDSGSKKGNEGFLDNTGNGSNDPLANAWGNVGNAAGGDDKTGEKKDETTPAWDTPTNAPTGPEACDNPAQGSEGDKKDENKNAWTKEQDEKLIHMKTEDGKVTWNKISQEVGKTEEDCKKRFKTIKPNDRKANAANQGGEGKKEKEKKQNHNQNQSKGGNKKDAKNNDNKEEEKKNETSGVVDAWDMSGGNGDVFPGLSGGDTDNSKDDSGNKDTSWDGLVGGITVTDTSAWDFGNATGGVDGANDTAVKWDFDCGGNWNTASNNDQDKKKDGASIADPWNPTAPTQNSPSKQTPSQPGSQHKDNNNNVQPITTRPLELEVKPDDTFSADDLRLVARILQQDCSMVWNRVSWRFRDKTGRTLHPDEFEKKITGRLEGENYGKSKRR